MKGNTKVTVSYPNVWLCFTATLYSSISFIIVFIQNTVVSFWSVKWGFIGCVTSLLIVRKHTHSKKEVFLSVIQFERECELRIFLMLKEMYVYSCNILVIMAVFNKYFWTLSFICKFCLVFFLFFFFLVGCFVVEFWLRSSKCTCPEEKKKDLLILHLLYITEHCNNSTPLITSLCKSVFWMISSPFHQGQQTSGST